MVPTPNDFLPVGVARAALVIHRLLRDDAFNFRGDMLDGPTHAEVVGTA